MNSGWQNESVALIGIAWVLYYYAVRAPEGRRIRPRRLADWRWLTWLAVLGVSLGACHRWGFDACGAVLVGAFALFTLGTLMVLGARGAWRRLIPCVRRVFGRDRS